MDAKAAELLKVFDLLDEAETLASNLPYGKQRRLEIARAMATDPKLLLSRRAGGRHEPQGDTGTDGYDPVRREIILT